MKSVASTTVPAGSCSMMISTSRFTSSIRTIRSVTKSVKQWYCSIHLSRSATRSGLRSPPLRRCLATRLYVKTLGGTAVSYLRVSGLIVGVGELDTRGRVLGDANVVNARVSSMSGEYRVNLRRVAKVDELPTALERASGVNAERPETAPDFAAALEDRMANAAPIGRLGSSTGGNRACGPGFKR